MANSFTPPVWIKSKPSGGAEKQVGDSDPSARTDVINRVEKGLLAVLKRLFNTITDGVTADFTDQTTITEFANAPIVPRAVSGTPAQHGLFRENVIKGRAQVTGAGVLTQGFNVASITDGGAGDMTVVWDRDFADTKYTAIAGVEKTDVPLTVHTQPPAAGSVRFLCTIGNNTQTDPGAYHVIAIGAQ